jgi:hypothetical protein
MVTEDMRTSTMFAATKILRERAVESLLHLASESGWLRPDAFRIRSEIPTGGKNGLGQLRLRLEHMERHLTEAADCVRTMCAAEHNFDFADLRDAEEALYRGVTVDELRASRDLTPGHQEEKAMAGEDDGK